MTNIYASVSLDPFLQYFLRGYYECDDHVFSFPRASRKNWLMLAFKSALWYPPKNYNPLQKLENEFRIEIPEMNDKDPTVHNYISASASREFEKSVRTFYTAQAYPFFDEMRGANFKGPSIVTMFMDRFSIPVEFEDAIRRDYSRFSQMERNKTWKTKKKKTTLCI